MRVPLGSAALLALCLAAGPAHGAIVAAPVKIPAPGGGNAGAAAIAGAAGNSSLSPVTNSLSLGRSILPPASEDPGLVLSAISQRYGTDPSPDAVADLGEGDYAEVRSGIHPVTAEPVAVKIPYLDPGGMIAHEAAMSRRLQEAGGGDLFVRTVEDPEMNVLVMEKLDGYRTLDEWMEGRSKIGPRTVKRISAQLERGLRVLEEAGLVHSDLKPDNIMVGPGGKIKIVDFGLMAEKGGYVPYPEYEGWRGGLYVYTSENQLSNGPAAFEDDRHAVRVLVKELHRAADRP